MRLRFRHPDGTATLPNADPNDSLAALKEQIGQLINLPSGKVVKLSGGYPPKPYNDDAAILSDLGFKDGDALIVTISSAPTYDTNSLAQPTAAAKTTMGQQNVSRNVSGSNSDDAVEVDGGYLVVREMKDDNSCLFRSIGYVLNRDIERTRELREVVAASIQSDPINYSDAILGRPVDQYVEWILKPNSWGGAIELAIFSKYFEIEIDSFDVANGRTDKFGEGQYDERVLVMYTGIHYDALALAPIQSASVEFDQTRFSSHNDKLLQAGVQLANKLKQQRKYTDTSNFTLKCNDCNQGLIGERDATTHASKTGHTHFVEYL